MKRILGALAIVMFLAANAQAAILVQYQFNDLNPAGSAPTQFDSGITATPFKDSDGALNYTMVDGTPVPSIFRTYTEMLTDSPQGTFDGTLYPHYEFTVSAVIPNSMTIESLVLNAQKTVAASTGNVNIYIRTNLAGDNFATNVGIIQVHGSDLSFRTDLTTSFIGAEFTNATSATFRIYARDAGDGSANEFRLDNVRLEGVVPEPASMAVWGIGLAMVLGGAGFRFRGCKVAKAA